jgi:FMN-dependent NADH-azoreductase
LGVQLGSPPPQDRISADGSIALAETLIAELEGADTIVIGVPMYNFTVPSTLKAWIDHIVRAGRTFNYVDGAPLGLLPPGKKVILFVASGGAYSEGPMKAFDFIEPYLRFVLAFVGLSDVTVVRAEKQALPDIAIPERSNAILRTNGLSV